MFIESKKKEKINFYFLEEKVVWVEIEEFFFIEVVNELFFNFLYELRGIRDL